MRQIRERNDDASRPLEETIEKKKKKKKKARERNNNKRKNHLSNAMSDSCYSRKRWQALWGRGEGASVQLISTLRWYYTRRYSCSAAPRRASKNFPRRVKPRQEPPSWRGWILSETSESPLKGSGSHPFLPVHASLYTHTPPDPSFSR